jgi:hypothetical protein
LGCTTSSEKDLNLKQKIEKFNCISDTVKSVLGEEARNGTMLKLIVSCQCQVYCMGMKLENAKRELKGVLKQMK